MKLDINGKVALIEIRTGKTIRVFAVDAREILANPKNKGDYRLKFASADPRPKEELSEEQLDEPVTDDAVIDDPANDSVDASTDADDEDDIILDELNVAALQSLCVEREIEYKGLKKAELIAAIAAHEEAKEATEVTS